MVRMLPDLPVFKDFLRQRPLKIVLIIVLDSTSQLLRIGIPISLAIAYGQLFNFNSVRGQLLHQWGLPVSYDFGLALWCFGGITAAHLVLRTWVQHQQANQSEALLAQLRTTLFEHQLNVPMEAYEESGIGRYLLRYSGDLGSIKTLFQKGILQCFADLLTLTIGLVLVSILDATLGWTALAFMGATLLILWLINCKLLSIETQRRNKKSALLAFVNRCLLGMSSIKAFNRMTPELGKFSSYTTKIEAIGQMYNRYLVIRDTLLTSVSYTLIGVILYQIYQRVQMGVSTDMVALFAIVIILISWRTTLLRMGKVGLIWRKGYLSLAKIQALLSLPREDEIFGEKPVSITQTALHWETKAASKGVNVLLDNLSDLSLTPGCRKFIYSPPGSGKSTFTKLIAGMYASPSLCIHIGSTAINDANLKDWRRQVTYVSTSFPLYGRTIGEALAYSRRHYKKSKKRFEEWQVYFPKLRELNWDTPLREINRLSSSQELLLLWLRAYLTNKPIWILDEPFRGLETQTIAQLIKLIPVKAATLLLSSTREMDIAPFSPIVAQATTNH